MNTNDTDRRPRQKYYAIAAQKSSNGIYFYNRLFEKLKINAEYISCPVETWRDLAQKKLFDDFSGASVAAPFKKEIISHLDEISQVAQQTSSVNCIKRADNIILGHNTDEGGLGKIFSKNRHLFASRSRIVIYGSGGVVSSVIFALHHTFENPDVCIMARNKEAALRLCSRYDIRFIQETESQTTDLWINATPAQNNEIAKLLLLSKNANCVFDLNPIQKQYPFELHVLHRGQKFLRGFDFYKEQFLLQFEFLTGQHVNECEFDELANLRLLKENAIT
jgi:shikimate 5-dehydrogenase